MLRVVFLLYFVWAGKNRLWPREALTSRLINMRATIGPPRPSSLYPTLHATASHLAPRYDGDLVCLSAPSV